MTDRHARLRAGEEHVAGSPVPAAARLAPSRSRSDSDHSPHSHRFRTAIAVLFALALGSLGVALALTTSGAKRTTSGVSWSEWKPPDSGFPAAQEIADFLSPYYRATSAYQLAVVTATNLNDPANPVQIVVPSSGSSGALQALSPSSTIAYNLCGLGSHDCSIGVGQPSTNRLLLLRREALELALYTFKYVSGVQTVITILPPGHTQSCTGICPKPHTTAAAKPLDITLAFDRKELQPWLDRPLRYALPEQLPPSVSEMPNAPEAELVSVITAHGLFSERTEQAQDGSQLIVLSPLPPA